jgi:hypothetical protein
MVTPANGSVKPLRQKDLKEIAAGGADGRRCRLKEEKPVCRYKRQTMIVDFPKQHS